MPQIKVQSKCALKIIQSFSDEEIKEMSTKEKQEIEVKLQNVPWVKILTYEHR